MRPVFCPKKALSDSQSTHRHPLFSTIPTYNPPPTNTRKHLRGYRKT